MGISTSRQEEERIQFTVIQLGNDSGVEELDKNADTGGESWGGQGNLSGVPRTSD